MERPNENLAFAFVADFFEAYGKAGLTKMAALSEREYLEEFLRFANDDGDASLGALLSGTKAPPTDLRDETGTLAGVAAPTENLRHGQAVDRIAPGLRAAFIDVLENRLTSETAARRASSLSALGDPSHQIVTVHRFEVVGKELRRVAHLVPAGLRVAFAFAARMFVAADRPFGNELCRCQLESCRRFFFRRQDRRGGQPATRYCSGEHMEAYHRERTAERVRKHRASKRQATQARKPK